MWCVRFGGIELKRTSAQVSLGLERWDKNNTQRAGVGAAKGGEEASEFSHDSKRKPVVCTGGGGGGDGDGSLLVTLASLQERRSQN